MDNFEENDYGFNDFEDTYSNELNAGELVDVRIILTNLDYLEFLSKAVSNFDLSNFNVNISSIIPTKDIEIAKNTIAGADLVLVACENNERGHTLFQNFRESLKTEFNFIEYLKLPSLEELNDYAYDSYEDDNVFEDEIANSRKYYNAVVRIFNDKVQMFPSNLIANMIGYKPKSMFEASEDERKNVNVKL